MTDKSNASSSSPDGEHVKTGRGGAGNFVWQSEVEKRSREDPEAALPSSTAQAAASDSATTTAALNIATATNQASSTASPPTYTSTGRGGSGNYIASPTSGGKGPLLPTINTDVNTGPPSSSHSHSSPNARPPSTPKSIGRGGAGNLEAYYTTAQQQQEKSHQSLRDREDQIRSAIEENVDTGLQKPKGAWIEVPEGKEREGKRS